MTLLNVYDLRLVYSNNIDLKYNLVIQRYGNKSVLLDSAPTNVTESY
jgi:hypothetical protein